MHGSGGARPGVARVVVLALLTTALVATGLVTAAGPAGAAPAWSVVPSPTPSGAAYNGPLYSVSCATPTSCMALGPYQDNGFHPFGLRWNGATWSTVSMRSSSAAGANGSILFAVSCPTDSFCAAVGTYSVGAANKTLIERWNGTSWTIVPSPNPAGVGWLSLVAVSCTSSTSCLAVGDYQVPGSTATKTYIERWNGASWSVEYGANPAGATQTHLGGVSCARADRCAAVGWTNASGATRAFVERWNGTTWLRSAVPARTGATLTTLDAVSCPSVSRCFAVGISANAQGVDRTLIYRWNGTAWGTNTSPTPPATGGVALSGVSCASASECQAIGSTSDTNGMPTPFVERWHGGAWTIGALPVANPSPGSFNAVSCATASMCVAAGYRAFTKTWTARWNGSSWATVASPQPKQPGMSVLADVACATATDCLAVGRRAATDRTLGERWNGSSWSTVATPSLGSESRLNGVACATASTCFAVGNGIAGNAVVTLVEQWNGSSWASVSSPNPGGSFASLSAVSCPGATTCFAVGGASSVFIERWNGSSWSLVAVPSPAGASLSGVSCATTTDCVAVGQVDSGGGTTTLIERWNGSSWSIVTSPNRAGARSFLQSVSCASATWCVAVGHSETDSQTGPRARTLIERWNGTSWAIATSANPVNDHYPVLTDVSCASSSSCVAVGTSSPEFTCSCDETVPNLGRTILIERWNGTSWTMDTPADPAGAAYRELNGVTCVTGQPCFAVGAWQPSSNVPTHTLVERYA